MTGVPDALREAAHPFFFSLAQAPHDERYAPALVDAAWRLAWALDKSGACVFPGSC